MVKRKSSSLDQFSLTPLPMAVDGSLAIFLKPTAEQMVLSDAVEQFFRRIQEEYESRDRLAAHGLRPRKKILLYGLPGNGKSMAARRLAYDLKLPILSARLDGLVDSHLGETAKNVRKVFDQAASTPCVLLLDECDAVMRSRLDGGSGGADPEMRRVVNSILQIVEELDPPGVMVCTTNLVDSLDHAIFRRFDDVIEIPLPGPKERERLLEWYCPIDLDDSVSFAEVAASLEGRSADYVVKLIRDVAKDAILGGYTAITAEMIADRLNSLALTETALNGILGPK